MPDSPPPTAPTPGSPTPAVSGSDGSPDAGRGPRSARLWPVATPAELAPAPGFAHRLDQAIALTPVAAGRWRGHTDPIYWNMSGPFGGFVAAVLMQALMLREDRLGDPLALTVNFAGPLAEGPFEIMVQTRRSSRTTQHVHAEIIQGDDPANRVAATASAVFAIRRDVWSQPEARPPRAPGAEEVPVLGPRPGVRWPAMYEFRFVSGLPKQGAREDSRSVYWVKDRPDRPLDYPALASICDSSFPRIFNVRPQLTQVATVSMNTYFHGTAASVAAVGNGALLFDTSANVFDQGFSDQQATVWTPDGRLLATSQQVVWYKA